jgi:hypothetical protein
VQSSKEFFRSAGEGARKEKERKKLNGRRRGPWREATREASLNGGASGPARVLRGCPPTRNPRLRFEFRGKWTTSRLHVRGKGEGGIGIKRQFVNRGGGDFCSLDHLFRIGFSSFEF